MIKCSFMLIFDSSQIPTMPFPPLPPSPSSLLPPPSTTNGWHHARKPAKLQTCNADEIMKGPVQRFTVFWVFRYFFLSSFMFINRSLLFRNKKMMALLTAENRTRRQQGSRRVWCLDERPSGNFFFVSFFYFANPITVYV